MKPIRKADRLRFNAAVLEILAPFIAADPDPSWHHAGACRCMTDHGPLTWHPDPLEHGDRIPTVFARFRESGTPFGGYSGKWNIHTYDVDQALDELRRRVALVNARVLTPDERAEWHAKDDAERARWAALREEATV